MRFDMKVTHVPISPTHGGHRADDRFQGGSESPTKTTDGAAGSEDTDPAVSIQLSEDAQQAAPATTDEGPGKSAYSPAHRARAAMETYSAYSEIGHGPFGQLVSQIARGVFIEPTGSGEGEAGQGATTDETAGETTPDGATEPGGALPNEPEVVADEPEIAAGDEPAPEGETVVAGDEPAAEGETVVAGGATDSLAAAVIVENAAAIEAELIDELLEETTAE